MIRVLFLPLNYGDVIQDGVYNAFSELGCTVKVFDYMDKYLHTKDPGKIRNALIEEAKTFKPHLIHLQIQHTSVIDAETLRRIKAILPKVIISNWTGDVRNSVPNTYKMIAEVSDFNLISSTGQLEMFSSDIGKDVSFWQIGYNPQLYAPAECTANFKYDAVFVGHYTTKEEYPGTPARVQTCQLLKEHFGDRFGLFGMGWPQHLGSRGSLHQRLVTQTYQQSLCCVSVSHYNDLDHYFSDRLLMCMASGRPTIAYRFPKWESYFTNMCDLIIIDNIMDIPDVVRMLKDNPDLANYIGKSGAAKVFAEHTYYSRVKELLAIVGLS